MTVALTTKTTRIDPDQPMTFRDMLSNFALDYPIREFTQEEFDSLPRSTRFGPDYGWEKTGYLQNQRLGARHCYWEYVEFNGRVDDSDETTTYLVHVDGDVVIQLDPERF